MRFTLRTRLIFAFLGVSVVSVGFTGILVDITVRRLSLEQVEDRLRYEVTMTGQMTASALFGPLSPDDTSLQGPLTDLSRAVETQLSVLSPDGVVVANSEQPDARLRNLESPGPEVAQARVLGKASAIRGQGGERRLWVAERVVRDGQLLGIARASIPMSVIDEHAQVVRKRVYMAALAALALSSLIALGLSVGIARPIRRLAAAARRIGNGDLGARVSEPAGDEIGDLGKALNDMSDGLRAMIGRLDQRNVDMRRILDTIDQGLLVVALDGLIEEERSARIDEWFGSPAKGTKLWEMFVGSAPATREAVCSAWEQIAEDVLPVELAVDQLPKRIECGDRLFQLECAPIPETDKPSIRFLVIVSNVTALVEAERKEEQQRDVLRLLGHSLRDRAAVADFLVDARQLVTSIEGTTNRSELRRALHTLKGNCAVLGAHGITALCHAMESRLADGLELSAAEKSLLLSRWSAFQAEAEVFVGSKQDVVLDEVELAEVVLALLMDAPQDVIAARIASWTHTPVQAALTLLGERAQTVAATLGKGPLDVRIEHDRTRLDREHWTPVLSGLVHAVRNAVDHGFEGPEERARLGKPSQPVLQLRARHVDDQFVVEITDDGRGIAWARVAEELRLRGLPAETASDLAEGLFVEGLSTTRRVTDVSGRGIGMSALREAVHARGGTVEITSVGGKGTTLTCRFPAVQLNIEEFVAKPRAQLMALRARELPAGAPLSRRMQV